VVNVLALEKQCIVEGCINSIAFGEPDRCADHWVEYVVKGEYSNA
jgi:hypothetical protein